MGVRLWCYLRRGPGEMQQLSPTALESFLRGSGRLDADQGIVRYVEVIVTLEQRRVIDASCTGYFEAPATSDGRFDTSRDDVHRWKPLDADRAAIRTIVHQRAGRDVLAS